jgi:NAD(P)-dependent dehydrogenase (short-subunit alcohol dehydrogenase family)
MAFNNAGIVGFTGDPADESAGSFDRVTAINLRGIWTCMKHELRRRGRPVNVAEKANDVCPRVVSSLEAPSHSDPRGRPNVTPFVTRTSGYETC